MSPETEVLPGVTEAPVTDAEALLEAHDAYVSNRSYRIDRTSRLIPQSNETPVRTSSVTILADAEGELSLRHTFDAPAQDGNETVVREAWASEDEDGVFIRNERWHEQQYEYTPRSTHDFTAVDSIETGLTAMDEFTVTTTHENGVTRYVLESDTAPYSYDNGSLRLVVHEAGYVESYRFEYDRGDGDQRETVVTQVTVDRVGDPDIDVTQPEWVPEARAEVGGEANSTDSV
ncbi:hypothetical protein [Natronosalvus halobius]|uniref:hypothetical protein n=1 Tax=Natronosalvus halobius TaxID=2953746 RepID=UPI0020A03563|nr:hypothetical protein [Natronosalvus halobius]USZ71758.1 hypothetical protein NGM15_00175 [Natronosalvus halobius]